MSATVSSSTTLWATASKEWVIPAKPKPGRKPKKDSALATQELSEMDNKGRRVQNRAAQRAFRERKQSQLAELQARVQQYEQGEVERNVALQNIAKRLKEENEKLRAENARLKEKVAQLEECLASQEAPKKRTRVDSAPRSPSLPPAQLSRKKSKISPERQSGTFSQGMNGLYDASSPSSSGSSPRSNTSSHTSFSPLPSIPSPQETSMNNTLSNMFDFSADAKSALFDGGPLSCGFCNATSTCVCKDITMQQVSEQLSLSNISAAAVDHSDIQQSNVLPNDAPPSILENLPEYQAPVPLRRRAPAQAARPIFPISPAPNASNSIAVTCSGDPSNCLACADDAFGKAFCDAISKTVASTSSSCGYCPDPSQASNDGAAVNGCCGNPIACGGMGCSPATADMSAPASLGGNDGSMMMTDEPSTSETISCDNAWRQLKSHPNVAFADLSLLAEVVARRSKCTGPRVEILPAPGSVTPERALSPPAGAVSHANTNQHSQHSFSDPRATYDENRGMGGAARSPPPQLVPQEVLISCGRQRVREVMADGVRDALRILDAKFPVPGRMSNFRM